MNSIFKRLAVAALLVLAFPLTIQAASITIYPNGPGDTTNLGRSGVAATNWQANLAVDGDTAYVFRNAASYDFDLYNFQNPGLAGTINSVQVFVNVRTSATATQPSMQVRLKTPGGSVVGPEWQFFTNYTTRSISWANNPVTAAPWTWADIDSLQAGANLKKPTGMGASETRMTAIWIVVDYDPPVVNAPPVATNNSYTVNEDTQLNTGNLITDDTGDGVDSDADGDPLTASKVSDPTNGTAVVNGNGTFTYDPDPNFCGADSFTYKVNDGTADSNTATVSITVTCVNDAPSFTKGADENVNEDAGAQTVVGWATEISPGPANEAGQTVSFNVSNDNNALFSVQPAVSPTGTLTYTPAADANGVANVTINIMDDGGTANGGVDTSADQFFTITVNPVNDAPTFTAQDASSNEDAGPQSGVVVGNNFVPGPANESGQSLLNCIVTNVSVPGFLLSSGPTVTVSGDECHLAYTAAADANGSFTFDLQVQDDGGTANGGEDTSSPAQRMVV
ncbi:MAG: Ig-like domain-containing protein [Xanthomonadales bacterium]|nr:Ig-like domain-containing protein [Xanthomonadales bacterium]